MFGIPEKFCRNGHVVLLLVRTVWRVITRKKLYFDGKEAVS